MVIIVALNVLLTMYNMMRLSFLEKSINDKMNDIREILKDIRENSKPDHLAGGFGAFQPGR